MARAATIVLWNLIGATALLLVAEAASRVLAPTERPQPLLVRTRGDWPDSWTYDRLLFWRMLPHAADGNGHWTNALGLRGPEVPPKSENEFRILSLGESSTYGHGVSEEQTYSRLLETGLGSVEDREVRVINAGVPGYTTIQGLEYLRSRGLRLQPDAVLFYFGYNDFLAISYRARRDNGPELVSGGWTDRELLEHRSSLRLRVADALIERSNLARLLSARAAPDAQAVRVDRRRPRVPLDDRRRALEQLRELAHRNHLRLVVVIPWYREFEGHAALLRELADRPDVVLVDLPAEFEAIDGNARFFLDPAHPNAAGHRRIAAAIERSLRRAWNLAAPPGEGVETVSAARGTAPVNSPTLRGTEHDGL